MDYRRGSGGDTGREIRRTVTRRHDAENRDDHDHGLVLDSGARRAGAAMRYAASRRHGGLQYGRGRGEGVLSARRDDHHRWQPGARHRRLARRAGARHAHGAGERHQGGAPRPDGRNQSPVPSSFNGAVPAPMVEGALGLFKGVGGGLLAVDLLGSALILPTGIQHLTVDSNATHISDAALGLGFGARVGVLKGAFPIPSVSVSWMHRSLPRLRYGTLGPTFGSGDRFEFTMDLDADSYRAVAG